MTKTSGFLMGTLKWNTVPSQRLTSGFLRNRLCHLHGGYARTQREPKEEIHLPAMSPFLPHGHQRLFMGWPWETEGKVHEAGRSPTVGAVGGTNGLTDSESLIFFL